MTNQGHFITKMMAFTLVVSLFFFCQGGSLGMMVYQTAADHQATNMDNGPTPACCSMEQASMAGEHHANVFILPAVGRMLLLIALFVLAGAAVVWNIREEWSRLFPYDNAIRKRYGSYRFFFLFARLFRLGILHPKIW